MTCLFLLCRTGSVTYPGSTTTMAEDFTWTNVYMAYISNRPFDYPSPANITQQQSGSYNTGYHILPNMLFRHYCTPKQWAEFIINYEAYKINGYTITIFNPVPKTTQLAIQGNTLFTAFNNTIYGWGYQDRLYETSWHPWFIGHNNATDSPNQIEKEGLRMWSTATKTRYILPVYSWNKPTFRVTSDRTFSNYHTSTFTGWSTYPFDHLDNNDSEKGFPSGLCWDPMYRPDELFEFRPGKNAMSFQWNTHDCDSGKWFNTDLLCLLGTMDCHRTLHRSKKTPRNKRYLQPVRPCLTTITMGRSRWFQRLHLPKLCRCPYNADIMVVERNATKHCNYPKRYCPMENQA
ncbi:capsid protein 1 [Galliform chaphamaparvovirus 12]|nr:capsid protein 1 [Galliform chaphamaparvovirus 12]